MSTPNSSRTQNVKKETAAQRKLREAQEMVKAAKQKEQEAWRAEWEAKQKDPAYIAKQARLAENRKERARKVAIGKENAKLARIAELMELAGGPEELEETAYHEAGHAVIHEVLGNGVVEATVIPQDENKDSDSKDGHFSLGHVSPHANSFPISEYRRNLHAVVGSLAGGMVVHSVYDLDYEDDGTVGDEENVEKFIKWMNLDDAEESQFLCEAYSLGEKLLNDPKIWAAIEEVKEALLTYKTIPGDVVRAIVKKQDRPELFPVVMTKQLSFHYRKEFFTNYPGTAPYSLGVGEYHQGFTLSNPQYVLEFLKANKAPKDVEKPPVLLPTQLVLDLRPVEVQKAA